MIASFKRRAMHSSSSWFASAALSQMGRRDLIYRVSEPNSPSVIRVRIFIFRRTPALVRMIWRIRKSRETCIDPPLQWIHLLGWTEVRVKLFV